MRRRRPHRGLLGPLALSVAAHAALLVALLRWPLAPPPAPPARPLLVTLEPRAVPVSPLPRASGGEGQGEGVRGARRPSVSGSPALTREELQEALAGEPARRPGPRDLAPRLPGGAPAEVGAPAPSPGQAAGSRVAGVMESLHAEELARYPDASWTDLRDALGRGFAPPDGALGLAKGGGAGGGPGALGRWLGGLPTAMERYGKTGSPIAPGPDAPGARAQSTRAAGRTVAAAGASGSPERSALAQSIDALDALPGPTGTTEHLGGLVAVVAVRLDEQGAVRGARLVARSASAEYDRAALEQATRLAGRVLSRRLAGTETEWAFVTEVRIRPLAPAAAVQFDATFKPDGFAAPLQRVVRTRVELRAVRRG